MTFFLSYMVQVNFFLRLILNLPARLTLLYSCLLNLDDKGNWESTNIKHFNNENLRDRANVSI